MQNTLLKESCWTPPVHALSCLLSRPQRNLTNNKRNSCSSTDRNCSRFRAMPCSSFSTSSTTCGDGNGSLVNFKLNESTFLASLMPKKEIAADRFIESFPHYDGRGVLIAIFDSGVDPAADGLQVTSDGKPKILDVLDCTGSGDIDTSKVVKADADGCILGASGASLFINSSWKNPSGEWHVGCKLVYELFTNTLTSRLKKERKKKWDERNQEEIAKAVKQLEEFDKKHTRVEDANLKRTREDLQNRIDILRKQVESYDDKGPIIDAVVWHDGEVWRVAVDTQSLEDDPDCGKLADFAPLTNYRTERKFGVFSKLDACTFVTNVYGEGKVLSIVTDCSPHGTHVAGIATAFHPKEPLLNGVAPGAQLISCKIGDSRLGSMETGTGLTRALIAAVEHKCDLINMSYGEPILLPDYGRFVDLVNEVVNKHRLIFVSSAGNSGPALSTVGAPGGTSSSIIGVGAYVSPAMAAGAHAVVEPPSEGLEYTWSSRGPTADGDLGVCISAPGGAVAPVPKWTLQGRMLMNGTSMASPSACGGVALLISAMKAEGIPVSPYSVRKALENTSVPVGGLPEDKLSTGQGLMQVDKAHEYIKQSQNVPCVWYQIKINQSGKPTPTSRGIYLREASTCKQSTEWTVQVEPKFHEGASNLEDLVPFEECIELHSTEKSVVRAPDYVLLTHNGRSFNIVVDPTTLSDGLHYYELYGVDCKAPWRGPLFRIPVTITKPMAVMTRPPIISFSKMSFKPGQIERKYIEVPVGASWVEATMRISGFDTARRFFVDTVQLCPLQRPSKWESVFSFSSPTTKSFAFPVVGGLTMELAIAQFWSSGIGSHDTTIVDFEVVFHGIGINKEEVALDGSAAPIRIDAETLLASEKLAPAANLNKIRVSYRPVEAKLSALPTNRDKLPSGKQILALTIIYKFKLEDGAEVKPYIPLLNNRIYDTKFESQFYMISDTNKRVYSMGDVYPNSSKLPKGDYNLHLYLRHDNMQYLEKMKQLVLFIEKKLEGKDVIQLSFFSQPDGPLMGNGSFKSTVLVPGKREAFYLGPPSEDKIPKNSPPGSLLVGAISYGKLSFVGQEEGKNPQKNPASYRITYIVPPNKIDEDMGKGSSPTCKKSVFERVEEEVRDAKIKVFGSLKQDTDEEVLEWKKFSVSLNSEYPKYTPLLAKILEGVLSRSNVGDKIHHNREVIDAANEVIDSIDREELAKSISLKSDPEDEETEKNKKKMETTRDQLAEALYQKGLALAEIDSLQDEKPSTLAATEGTKDVDRSYVPDSSIQPDLFEENFKELKKWVDVRSSKYGTLLVLHEKRHGRLGTALKVLNDIIQDNGEPPKKKFYELKLSLLDDIGWSHLATYEREWLHVRFPTSLPLF
ncbi:Peptidase_S8 domain-containing protein/TPPII domain-containing protein [Cephalotus follicularis]|uniref:Tripeptidyl-peptidase 2 n=1 Tax=Cephalotus follicularis TaxID=3775 RepID=A0A1Q3CGC0_CEPFO|nr:Peptidase_S8 domain-containing protein/TPPII domain-containing protein [Cephalotus follicularis]